MKLAIKAIAQSIVIGSVGGAVGGMVFFGAVGCVAAGFDGRSLIAGAAYLGILGSIIGFVVGAVVGPVAYAVVTELGSRGFIALVLSLLALIVIAGSAFLWSVATKKTGESIGMNLMLLLASTLGSSVAVALFPKWRRRA